MKCSSVRSTLLTALLVFSSACQNASFVSHAPRMEGGRGNDVTLRVSFGSGDDFQGPVTRELVACVSQPRNWGVPEGTYSIDDEPDAVAEESPDAAEAADTEFPQPGYAWHCLASDLVDSVAQSAFAEVHLSVFPPAGDKGTYKLSYLTGYRAVQDDGSFSPTSFVGRMQRTLSVGQDGARTTFDEWELAPFDDEAGSMVMGAGADEVAYGNGHFLGVVGGQTGSQLLFSATGQSWEAREAAMEGTGEPVSLTGLTPAFGRWYAASGNTILVSANGGVTWRKVWEELIPSTPPAPLKALVDETPDAGEETPADAGEETPDAGEELPADAGEETPDAGEETPADGGVTEPEFEPGRSVFALAFGGGKLVAVGEAGLVLTSTDGETWVDQSVEGAEGETLASLVFSDGTFLAGGTALARSTADGSGFELVAAQGLPEGALVFELAASETGSVAAFSVPGAVTAGASVTPLFVTTDRGSTWRPASGMALTIPDDGEGNPALPAFVLDYVDSSFVFSTTESVANAAGEEMQTPTVVRSSVDGITWLEHATGYAGGFVGLAQSDTRVVAVSGNALLVANKRAWPGPQFTQSALPRAVVGRLYSTHLGVSSAGGQSSLTLEGALPAGLSFANEIISGTATATGSFPVTAAATDARGNTTTQAYTLEVVGELAITTAGALSQATVGQAYTATLAAEGGLTDYTWTKGNGNLPPGLTLAQEGNAFTLKGTPTGAGKYTFNAKVADADGVTKEQAFTVEVADAKAETAQGCGCTQTGGTMGLELLAFAGLGLLRRRTRRA